MVMVIEILFPEVCGLFGDSQNPTYLQATLPDAQFIFTKLTDLSFTERHCVKVMQRHLCIFVRLQALNVSAFQIPNTHGIWSESKIAGIMLMLHTTIPTH